ncbi:hypothetical protein [Candidatus Ferrigenium straubiae]|jgi:phenylacetate-coenzyme A ligase PaaK-like adenylate-forming protein|uniref:LuxE/PaaK family acyltransferase n=1 Tax=Candidatus Ferrigenium straubiae TaxID=2919506 RepID=UPI003F4AEF33
MSTLDEKIDAILTGPPYGPGSAEAAARVFTLLREQVIHAASQSEVYANYVRHWPIKVEHAQSIEELPYIPVSVFKRNPPLALVPSDKIQRTLLSSATTGQEPSRIAIDAPTAKRMTKGVVAILRDFIGSARRPYLVVDSAETNANAASLGARGAAIRALSPFATETVYCLKGGNLDIDDEALGEFIEQHGDKPVIVYGFTSILWTKLITPLAAKGKTLGMQQAVILHSGGWKKLIAESVTKEVFNITASQVFGCQKEKVIDYYGMVENLGIIYPDCIAGNKHAPAFGAVVIRDPLTLKPVITGGTGIVQVCSALPTSFPGHLLLTEDLATLIAEDGCPCGRPGSAFRFVGRISKAEVRGCGNIDRQRIA